jgi:hypothetical protein
MFLFLFLIQNYNTKKPQVQARHGAARRGTARHGAARHGTARRGTARHGTARRGTARHGAARRGSLFPFGDFYNL